MASLEEQMTKVFNEEIKLPFHYNLDFTNVKNIEELFNQIYQIYKVGLCTLYGTNKTINCAVYLHSCLSFKF